MPQLQLLHSFLPGFKVKIKRNKSRNLKGLLVLGLASSLPATGRSDTDTDGAADLNIAATEEDLDADALVNLSTYSDIRPAFFLLF